MCDTTLEEFLEELDALTDPEVDETKVSPIPLSLSTSEEVSGSTAPVAAANLKEDSATHGQTETSSPRSSEKKVRFSEELVQAAHAKSTTNCQGSADSESRCFSSLKASSPLKKQGPQQSFESAKLDDGSPHDQRGGPSALPVAEQQPSETECTRTDSNPSAAPHSPSPERARSSSEESSAQSVELAKCNISNTNTGATLHQYP